MPHLTTARDGAVVRVTEVSYPTPEGDRVRHRVEQPLTGPARYRPIGPAMDCWSPEMLLEHFRRAMATLRRTPLKRGDCPADARAAWPDVVREAVEAYGWDSERVRRLPTAAEIAHMDRVIWLLMREPDRRRRLALCCVAVGMHYRAAARAIGVGSHHTVKAWCESSLRLIAADAALRGDPVPALP